MFSSGIATDWPYMESTNYKMSFSLSSNAASPFAPVEQQTYQLTSPMLGNADKEVDNPADNRMQLFTPMSHSRNVDSAQCGSGKNYYYRYEMHSSRGSHDSQVQQYDLGAKCRRRQPIPFSADEDDFLTFLVQKYGHKNWKTLAMELNAKFLCGRTPEQISQHWLRVVNPQIVKGKWSKEEDDRLIEACRMCQPKQWKQIANMLSGRSDIQVRYRLDRLKKHLLTSGRLTEDYLP